jgi:hypothetical protein
MISPTYLRLRVESPQTNPLLGNGTNITNKTTEITKNEFILKALKYRKILKLPPSQVLKFSNS